MKKRSVRGLCLALAASAVLAGGYIASGAGTGDDPLISLSYLNSVVIPDIMDRVEKTVSELLPAQGGQSADTADIEERLKKAEDRVAALSGQLEEMKKAVDGLPGSFPQTGEAGGSFESLQVFAGQTILGGAGCEIILRIGNAVAVCPGENGLVDATGGLDLTGGKTVERNHVYIVPREDGRGIAMKDDGYVMIKGAYTVDPAD